MHEPTINCPKCSTEIKLTESLAAPLIQATERKYAQAAAKKEVEFARREKAVEDAKAEIAKRQEAIDEQVRTKIAEERGVIAKEEAKKARTLLQSEMNQKDTQVAELQTVLADRDKKLSEAQKAQADVLRKSRELDDAKREIDLTVEKKVQESLGHLRVKAKQEAEDALKLQVVERDEKIAAMARQIDDLKRRSEQGSQQLQGEALELELESTLRGRFPKDSIEPVPKGEFGGDLIQRVRGPADQECGVILWELKRTKNWSDGWLAKLRGDQRAAKADVAMIVTNAMPKGVSNFDLMDGVWVTEARCAVPVAIALRQTLIELAGVRTAAEGQQTKAELVYRYLTGPRFKQRIEAIVEKFADMQEDLDKERKNAMRLWAKRESQISGVIEATAGMFGDLQGIAGKALHEIDGLSLPLLEVGSLKDGG